MTTADNGPLQIRCLGGTEIIFEGEGLSGTLLRKAQALLVYLALKPGRHERDALAALLWSQMPDDKARANLRTALYRLRRPLAAYVESSSRSVAFNSGPGAWVDVVHFERGVVSDSPAAQREALALYQGEFLDGFAVPNAALFEEWALLKRERLRGLALDGLAQMAESALQDGEYGQAVADLRRLLALDPWREAAHRSLMRALAARGDRGAALAQFERCRQALAADLGVEPAPATVALYEQIKEGKQVAGAERQTARVERPAPGASPAHNLPAETTPFVGRREELEQIAGSLAEPGCRLLTLFGPGGIGKTRLALQAARRATDAFAGGVCLVALETVAPAERVATAIAEALDVPLSGRHDPRARLLGYLRERELLLVLDNFEHLMPAADLLVELLETAPGVKLLVTSREALNLYEEWLLEVRGLRYPAEAGADNLAQFDAAALFLQRARQVQVTFELKGNEGGVLEICRLLRGMPLGIEMAAAWVRTVPPAQIARRIAEDLGDLATSLRNVPDRHRSMVAVFDHSWQLLQTEERQLLRRLTVFRGGFTAAAAGDVLGADRRELAALVDKALLEVMDAGRYHIHPLIRHFAAKKMADYPDEQTADEARHAAYYAALLATQERAVTGPGQNAAFQLMARELSNVRRAWATAIAREQTGYIDQMVTPLYHFLSKRGLHGEGIEQFGRAVEALRDGGPPAVLARLLVCQGRLSEHISENYELPHGLLIEGLSLARQQQLPLEIAQALMGLGTLSLVRGDLEQAEVYLHECLAVCDEAGLAWVRASALVMVAWLRSGERKWQAAKEACREAIALHRQNGDESGVASALTALGNVYVALEQFGEAEEAYGEALAICRQRGHRIGEGQALTGLFNACYYQDKLAQAAAYARESLAVSRDVGDRLGTAIAYHNLGFLAAKDGRHREAVDHYQQTLAIYGTMDADGTRHSNTLRYLAESLLALGETESAAGHVYEALQRLPQAATSRRGSDFLLTAVRLLQQRGDEELASAIVSYLQQQALLPDRLEPALSALLEENGPTRPAPIVSRAQGLAAVRNHLARLLDEQD